MSIVMVGSTSGSITLQEPAVAGSTVLTLPAVTGTILTTTSPKAGNVIQVVSTTKTDTFTTTTASSWVDITGMSVSITPTSSSSKIFIVFTGNATGTTGTNGWALRLVRDSTAIGVATSTGSRTAASTGGSAPDSNWVNSNSLSTLDSPSTTSQITYKIQCQIGAGTFYFNRSQTDSDVSGYVRTASTITVMEIAA